MTSTNEASGRSHIVVGMDGSSQSLAALRWAAGYAMLMDAELELVHVPAIEPSEMYGVTVGLRDTITKEARETLTDLVTATIGSSGGSSTWRLHIAEGLPGAVLVKRSAQADLLVLGTGEHTGLRRLVTGSVSHYCLSHARSPVVAVPAGALPPGHSGSTGPPAMLADSRS